MSQVMSIRLPEETIERFKRLARRGGRSLNEMGAISIEEWLRVQEFADIEFRLFGAERHACLKGALPVWQLIMVAQGLHMDEEKTADYFEFPVHRVRAAFHYYEAFPSEIDLPIEDNRSLGYDQLKRLLPQLRLVEVDLGTGELREGSERDATAEGAEAKGEDAA